MTKERWIILAVVLVALAVALFFLQGRSTERLAVDLFTSYDAAEKRPAQAPPGEGFSTHEVTMNSVTKRAIATPPTSRITWKVDVPLEASLRTWIGIQPDVWTAPGDGVLFRIGVSDGRAYEELLSQHLNPAAVTGDRQWIPLSIDLFAYAGRSVTIIFNTNASLPNRGNDTRNDKPVWGDPAIYVRN